MKKDSPVHSNNRFPLVWVGLVLCCFVFALMFIPNSSSASAENGHKPDAIQNTTPEPEAAQSARAALETLLNKANGPVAASVSRQTGVYDFVSATGKAVLLPDNAAGSPESRARNFLAEHGGIFGMTGVEREILKGTGSPMNADGSNLTVRNVLADQIGKTHVKFDQQYKGLKVFGAQVVVHLSEEGVTAVNGNFIPNIAISIKPNISSARAGQIALATVRKTPDERLKIEKTELSIYHMGLLEGYKGRSVLAYSVEVRSADINEQVWINAKNGNVINRIPLRQDAVLHRIVYTPAFDPAMPDNNIVIEEGDPDIPESPPTVGTYNLYHWAKHTFNLYKSAFNRDSYDGIVGGTAPQRTVLLANDQCPNAYWDGQATNYCPDFDKDDVVSHEWTHAYTQYTHNLIYSYQSGALNEAYSDIFGETLDLNNGVDGPGGSDNANVTTYTISGGQYTPNNLGVRWRVGEDVQGLSQPVALGILRDMWTPIAFADPDRVSAAEYQCDSSDGGGVHTNSGVPNLGFAILVDGRVYNGQTVTGIGFTRALHIYYRAMTVYQIESTNFPQHELALRRSCNDLIGQPLNDFSTSSATGTPVPPAGLIQQTHCDQLAKAMLAVEMSRPPTQCDFQKMLDPNTPAECSGSAELFVEDWETGMDGWTLATAGVTPADWPNTNFVVSSDLPDNTDGSVHFGSAAFAINPKVGEPNGGTCSPGGDVSGKFSITSPLITIPAEAQDPKIAFEHFVQSEVGFDGGNVKISVNGGPFTVVPQAEYAFNAPPSALDAAPTNTNPMAGEFAWHGANEGEVSGSWGTTVINLANLTNPGDTIEIRFEFGQDGCNGSLGWFVDKVRLYHCPGLQAPTLSVTGYTNPDTDGLYTLTWLRPFGATGPDQLQESTSCGPIFSDGADELLAAGANTKWTGSAQWASQPDPGTSSLSYAIPDGAAQNESLTMVNAIAIPALASASLSFTTTQGLENTYDIGHVEVSTNNFASFVEVASYTGPDGLTPLDVFQGTRNIDLSQFAGQSIKIRFRVTSDPFNVGQPAGWYIDNINVTASAFTDFATGISGTSFPVTKTSDGTFCYRVRTRYSLADSPWSNVVTTVVDLTAAPGGIEADVSPRAAPDGSVLSADVIQVRRFQNGSDTINTATNELQRADSAPIATNGDGMILSGDVVQTRRYQNGTDPTQSAAGPTSLSGRAPEPADGTASTQEDYADKSGGHALWVESTKAVTGRPVTVNLNVGAAGDESEYGFILDYDPAMLSNPVIGAGNAGAAVRACNTATPGRINCSVGAFTNNSLTGNSSRIGELLAGTDRTLITVTFDVAAKAKPGLTHLTLSNVNVANDAAEQLIISSMNGSVFISRTGALSGPMAARLTTSAEPGLTNPVAELIDDRRRMQMALRNPFGWFNFTNVGGWRKLCQYCFAQSS